MNRHLVRNGTFEIPTLDRFVARVFDDPFFGPRSGAMQTIDEGSLALDISEDETHVIVRASLPGFDKDSVDVEVNEGVLSIKAEHAEEHEESNEQFHRKERRYGSVHRKIALPTPVVEDEASAELKDGVLTLRFPRATKATGRKVRIG